MFTPWCTPHRSQIHGAMPPSYITVMHYIMTAMCTIGHDLMPVWSTMPQQYTGDRQSIHCWSGFVHSSEHLIIRQPASYYWTQISTISRAVQRAAASSIELVWGMSTFLWRCATYTVYCIQHEQACLYTSRSTVLYGLLHLTLYQPAKRCLNHVLKYST